MKHKKVFTYFKQGAYTYVLCEPNPERPKEVVQPNFMETGLALHAVLVNGKTSIKHTGTTDPAEQIRKQRERNNDRLPLYKEDKSLIGTATVI